MTEAIVDALPSAIAIIVGAAPVLALVLLMVTSRPVSVSAMFPVGWAAGIVTTATAIVLLADASAPKNESGGLSIPGAIIRIALGLLIGVLALRAWRERASAGTPKWMSGVGGWASSRALTMAYLLGSINPKNLALVAVGATAIVEATAVPAQQAGAIAVFAAIATAGVALPVVLQAVGGDRVQRRLEAAADWMKANGKTISAAVLATIAIILTVTGVGGLR